MLYFLLFLAGLLCGLALMFLFIYVLLRSETGSGKRKKRRRTAKKLPIWLAPDDPAEDNIIDLSTYRRNSKQDAR